MTEKQNSENLHAKERKKIKSKIMMKKVTVFPLQN